MNPSVTRRYRFSASHRLHSAALNDEENRQLYGKCNNPFGHGHDYTLEVTYTGKVDAETGLIAPGSEIDRLVEDKILRRFASKNINLDVSEFADRVPTTENVAAVIAAILQKSWCIGSASLARVHVQETDRNGFEIRLCVNSAPHAGSERNELVHV